MKNKYPLSGLHELGSRKKRLIELEGQEIVDMADIRVLTTELEKEYAERLVEYAIGLYQVPIGITCIKVNDKIYYVMYATEETSVIAAANKASTKFWDADVSVTARCIGDHYSIGQILIIVPKKNIKMLDQIISDKQQYLVDLANENVMKTDLERGGGVKQLQIEEIYPNFDGDNYGASILVYADTTDAMGANKIIWVCELLGPEIAKSVEGELITTILSNRVRKNVQAQVKLPNFDPALGRKIALLSKFGEINLSRAITNNKGVLNGLMAITLVTGNDTRALAMCFDINSLEMGNYSVTKWNLIEGALVGETFLSLDVGVVGGATKHPASVVAQKVMGVKTAKELRQVMAALGLAQNFAALRALARGNFSRGHMKLHAVNLAMEAGAVGAEIDKVVKILLIKLYDGKKITGSDAKLALEQVRSAG